MKNQKIIIIGLGVVALILGALIVVQNKDNGSRMERANTPENRGASSGLMMEGKSGNGGDMSMEGMPCLFDGDGFFLFRRKILHQSPPQNKNARNN